MVIYSEKINKLCIHGVINVNICIINQTLIVITLKIVIRPRLTDIGSKTVIKFE